MPKRIFALLATAALLALASSPPSASARSLTPDVQLLALYQPLLQFDPLEQFLPTKVESFITDADLEQSTTPGTWSVVKTNAAPGDLPAPGTGTWRLNQDTCAPTAPIGGLACYAAAGNQGSGGPAAYGRMVREDDKLVLQYWFFYYDDVYSYTYPPSDLIWQAHEGDWENVDIVLTSDGQPEFVGYSQHCLGQTRTWADTPRFDDTTHPIVHVALGSHANYFSAGTHPINPSCIPTQALALLQAMHLPPPVDYAFAGPTAGPPGSGSQLMPIHQLSDDTPNWVQFPGFWGELQYLHAPSPIGTVAFGTSPVGPAYHTEWADPLGTLATWPTG